MSQSGKVIVNRAVTGSIHMYLMSPAPPITTDEIVDAAVETDEAGVAIVHLVVRAADGNVRVRINDSLWIRAEQLTQSNAQQLREGDDLIRGPGMELAAPDTARDILALKGGEAVGF
jgi:uncharacterized protein (DUF849 family)